MNTKLCVVCGDTLPSKKRSDKRYCKVDCRVRAHKIRWERGTSQPRQHRGEQRTSAGFVEAAIGAAAIEALRREFAQAREQAEQDRAAESKRLRMALEVERELLRHELTTAADERLRTALDQQRLQLCAEFEAEKERLLAEAANAEEERRRNAIREERRLANEREGALYVLVNRLRFERTGAEDQKNAAERINTKLLAKREELREQLGQSMERCRLLEERGELLSRAREALEQRCGQLVERDAAARRELVTATKQCQRLVEKQSAALKELAETKARSRLRKEQFLAANEQIKLLCGQYEELRLEHGNLGQRLVGEYHGLIAAEEEQWMEWANQQCEGLAAENAHLRSQHYMLQDHNARLNVALQSQSDPYPEVVARLEATVMRQRRQLNQIEKQLAACLTLSADSTGSQQRQPKALPPASTEPTKRKRDKRLLAPRREKGILSGVLQFTLTAGGFATGTIIGEVFAARRQNALPASSQALRLEGQPSRPALPPKR